MFLQRKKVKSTQTVNYATDELSYCFQIDQVVFDKGKLASHLARFFSMDQYALNNLGRGSPNGHLCLIIFSNRSFIF